MLSGGYDATSGLNIGNLDPDADERIMKCMMDIGKHCDDPFAGVIRMPGNPDPVTVHGMKVFRWFLQGMSHGGAYKLQPGLYADPDSGSRSYLRFVRVSDSDDSEKPKAFLLHDRVPYFTEGWQCEQVDEQWTYLGIHTVFVDPTIRQIVAAPPKHLVWKVDEELGLHVVAIDGYNDSHPVEENAVYFVGFAPGGDLVPKESAASVTLHTIFEDVGGRDVRTRVTVVPVTKNSTENSEYDLCGRAPDRVQELEDSGYRLDGFRLCDRFFDNNGTFESGDNTTDVSDGVYVLFCVNQKNGTLLAIGQYSSMSALRTAYNRVSEKELSILIEPDEA